MAAQSYGALLTKAKDDGVLNRTPHLLARARAVAARLEPQTRVFRMDALNWNWVVNVIQSDDLDAFCM
jgi:hypothetical protein